MWDDRYSQQQYAYGKLPNDFLKDNLSHLHCGSSLCLADGEGRNSVFLAEQSHDVTSVDASAPGIQKAKQLADEKQVIINTEVADLAEYVIAENAWDNIVSIFCHLPPELRCKVHQSVVQGLKPGGVFCLKPILLNKLLWERVGHL